MKKKFITLALSMVLCLSMGMTALAAPSPSAKTSDDVLAEFKGSTPSERQRSFLNAILAKNPGAGTQITQMLEPVEITENDPAYDSTKKTITLDGQGKVKPTDTGWYIVHLGGEGTIVGVYDAKVLGDGSLFASKPDDGWSYFMGIQLASTNPGTQTPTATSGNGPSGQGTSNSTNGPASTTSGSDSTAAPKTGDFATPIAAEVVALLSVAGIALYVKKSAAR